MNGIKKAIYYRVAILVAAAGLLSGGKAYAFTDEFYTFGYIGVFQNHSVAIPPNPWTNTLTMKIYSAWTTYQLLDNGNQFIIRMGRTGGGWHFETIGGLYNFNQGYILTCDSFNGDCELNNE